MRTLILSLFLSSMMAWSQDAPKIIDSADLDALRASAGTNVTVEGPVTTIGTTQTQSITFINLGLPKKQGFVALIYQKNYPSFPNGFDAYKAQKIQVTGVLNLYKGETPQIEVSSPDQIKVISEPPAN